jgi:hypothetical protein
VEAGPLARAVLIASSKSAGLTGFRKIHDAPEFLARSPTATSEWAVIRIEGILLVIPDSLSSRSSPEIPPS